jgi:hypothetical protein
MRETLVRPHGAVGADDRSAGTPTSFPARALLRIMRLAGQGGRYVPGGSDALTGSESFINNPFTSDPVRFARNAAILEEDPTLASARRRWPGPIPPSGRCTVFARRTIHPKSASRS